MTKSEKLSEGSVLTKSIFFNFIGKVFPILAGFLSIPILVEMLGTERFGVLAIIWLIIGYFGILDFGFSKAIVYELGNELKLKEGNPSRVIGSITAILLIVGAVLGVLVIAISPLVIAEISSIPSAFTEEVRLSFIVVGIGIPITIVGNAWRGVLETYQEFKTIALIDSFMGGSTYLGLALISFFSDELVLLTSALLLIKLVGGCIFFASSRKLVPGPIFRFDIDFERIKSALGFGKWIAVSNTINPIMGHLDRYLIGLIITLSAVTFYTAPFDMVQKVNLLPISMTAVLFPAFTLTSDAIKKSSSILSKSVLMTLVFVFPMVACVVFFSEEILLLWLGQEFANQSGLVLQILAIGVFFNSTSQVIFTYIQAIGLPKRTAQIHMFEFVFYVPLLWLLISGFNIIGAALARSMRVFVDWCLLNYTLRNKAIGKSYIPETLFLGFLLVGILFATKIQMLSLLKIAAAIAFLVVYFCIIWFKFLDSNMKSLLQNRFTKK